MRVRMRVQTTYGRVLGKGDEADVDAGVARRWISRGLAEPAGADGVLFEDDEQPVRAAALDVDLSGMRLDELRALAAEMGVAVGGLRSKAGLADAIRAARGAGQEDEGEGALVDSELAADAGKEE